MTTSRDGEPVRASWATLTLSARAHEALSLDEMAKLGNRAVEMKVRLWLAGHADEGWIIVVDSWQCDLDGIPVRSVRLDDQHGHLADLMDAALDEYARRFAFTPDELVTIANQSGIEVQRA